MSLQRISLDPYLMARLYKCPLVPSFSGENASIVKDQKELSYLGNYRQKVLLLIQNDTNAYLNDTLFAFLTKILEACQRSMDDIALVNQAAQPGMNLHEICEQLTPERMILFGSFAKKCTETPLKENVIQTVEGTTTLYTDALEILNTDQTSKIAFWKALRVFFEIKN